MEKDKVHDQDKAQARDAVAELHDVMRYQLERAASAARKTIAEPMLIAPLIQRLCAAMKKVYVGQSVSLSIDINSDCVFFGEQRDFMELAGNLIDNACKYSNGKVSINAHNTDDNTRRPGLTLNVHDNGPGLKPEKFAQLMQRGMRGDEKADGHGIGLAIVAEIADAYQAEIKAVPSDLGGLQIIIAFPGF